jgi:hypothetical protein
VSTSIDKVTTVDVGAHDTALLLAASWEERCLFVPENLSREYRATTILMTVYDGKSDRREKHIRELTRILSTRGAIETILARHDDPLPNVRATISRIRSILPTGDIRLTIDTSTFTRKHLLQLLYGLDASGLLRNTQLLYSQPSDYHTADNEPVSKGIVAVGAIEGLAGTNWPSRDSLLVLFLSYEGRRAWALWEHLEANQTVVVIPDPPYRPDWQGRTEEQNRFLLSVIPSTHVFRVSATETVQTENFLDELSTNDRLGITKYNYRLAPLGTKAQIVGIYRFWRKRPGASTLVYASPGTYRNDRTEFPCEQILLLDRTQDWVAMGSR